MTSTLSVELVVFIFVLMVIAAAFDLWLIRTWKRYRENRKRNGAGSGFSPANRRFDPKASVLPPAKGGTGVPPRTIVIGKSEPAAKSPNPKSPLAAGKRGQKTVPPETSLSIRGKAGRTAHVKISMDLPEGESIRLTVESVGGTAKFTAGEKSRGATGPADQIPGAPAWWRNWLAAGKNFFSSFADDIRTSGRSLFALALILYLLTRLIGLTRFPIYFFTDEAVQTNFASEFIENDFKGNDGESFPVFFENAGQYEMNLSVYVQVIPYLLFGKSAFVTRAVSVLITLLAAAAIAWILKRAFHLPLWWSGVLLLSIIPVWFLHSRTAFEPGESIAFYAMFLYCYMRYRDDTPWMLLPMLLFGALSAYTYSPSQVMVAVTGFLLLISDIRYHWQHKRIALAGFGLLMVLALPYLRFLYLHPDANRDQLVIVGSYWLNDMPIADKIRQFLGQYLGGLDPRYWYLANPPEGIQHDIIRHLMKGYGHISLWSLPFAIIGLLLCLTNIRSSHFRTVLIALLAAPTGGAIAQITITRTLVMVIPVALLTALGVSWLLALFERKEDPHLPEFLAVWRERITHGAAILSALREILVQRISFNGWRGFWNAWRDRVQYLAGATRGIARFPRVTLALGLFVVLGSINIYMLWDSLTNGPTWYDNYELYGMQYGGEQLTSALVEYKRIHPDANLIVSSSWANGADQIFQFFLPPEFPMRTGTVLEYIQNYNPIHEQDVFVMTSEEYSVAKNSRRFSEIRVDQTLNYPNGQAGFYFAHLTYVSNIEEIIAAEKAQLALPVEEQILLGGEPNAGGELLRIVHSRFDMGNLAAGFDGNPYSLMRTQTANPMVLDIYFPEIRSFTVVKVRVGGAPTRLVATFYPSAGGDPQIYSATVDRASDYRDVEIILPAPVESDHIRLEIETVGEGEPTHVHVYEIQWGGVDWKNGIIAPSP